MLERVGTTDVLHNIIYIVLHYLYNYEGKVTAVL